MATPGMQTPKDAAPLWASALPQIAKTLRDLGIASPALFYTCGFVVLGSYSLRFNLGLQAFPAAQFISAGAGFVLILCAFAAVVLVFRKVLTAVFRWLDSPAKSSKFVRAALPYVLITAFAMGWLFNRLHLKNAATAAGIVISVVFFLSAEGWTRKLARLYVYFFSFLMCLIVLVWYAFVAYPAIPASFGGGKPRHAHIQVDLKSISPGLSQQLPPPALTSASARGDLEADIYLVTDSAVLLTVPRADKVDSKDGSAHSVVLQLQRSDVSAIFWDGQ